MIIPVIICGGSGSRLWPLSRDALPKQFLSFNADSKSLFQETLLRTPENDHFAAPIIVANHRHELRILEDLQALGITPMAVLLEPFGKNTAPAIALAAEVAQSFGHGTSPLLVMPADHVIEDSPSFINAVLLAESSAALGKIVTFGIVPDHAATGYGYIEKGAVITDPLVYEVKRFVEKPEKAVAEQLLASGNHYWNSGIFMFTADSYKQELERFEPEIAEYAAAAFAHAKTRHHLYHVDKGYFGQCPEKSVDHGIMEHTDNALIIPIETGWSDVGSWNAIHAIARKDEHGNSTKGDAILCDAQNCYVHSDGALTALVGVKDLVVIQTKDALLVSHRNESEQVKTLVNQLKTANRKEYMHSNRVYRPWGYYEDLVEDKNYRVKKIMVYPQQRLSLQFHKYRSEHWVIISGTAQVTRGKEQFSLEAGESTFIAIGEHHRLENLHAIPLEVIEVQMGSYVGEDDIVRLEDIYGRVAHESVV